jgi:hypothetical protein
MGESVASRDIDDPEIAVSDYLYVMTEYQKGCHAHRGSMGTKQRREIAQRFWDVPT